MAFVCIATASEDNSVPVAVDVVTTLIMLVSIAVPVSYVSMLYRGKDPLETRCTHNEQLSTAMPPSTPIVPMAPVASERVSSKPNTAAEVQTNMRSGGRHPPSLVRAATTLVSKGNEARAGPPTVHEFDVEEQDSGTAVYHVALRDNPPQIAPSRTMEFDNPLALKTTAKGGQPRRSSSDWIKKWSQEHGRHYWVNTSTHERTWTDPASAEQLEV